MFNVIFNFSLQEVSQVVITQIGNVFLRKIWMLVILVSLFLQINLLGTEEFERNFRDSKIVKSAKRIYLPECPGAHNPSIGKVGNNFLLIFRYQPKHNSKPWISHIGAVWLDENFDPISKIELLDTRVDAFFTPSQSEDARLFEFDGRLYIIFNDNLDIENPSYLERRDMYVAELFIEDDNFQLGPLLRLVHPKKYRFALWQKNWSPFVWNGNLLLSYSINPHEVLNLHWKNGACVPIDTTLKEIPWEFGALRGGTPAKLVDGEYLAFFHSGIVTTSKCSEDEKIWHYFMGAYSFSAEPPFDLITASSKPIDALEFYTYSSYFKRVIYPGGFIVEDRNLYLAYGKDDSEVWIATIDLDELKASMQPLVNKNELLPLNE